MARLGALVGAISPLALPSDPGFPLEMNPAASPDDGAHLVDVDLDGRLDLLTRRGSGITVQRGDGFGYFGAENSYPIGLAVTEGPVITDLNGDGTPDVVVASALGTIHARLNDGNGVFLATSTTATSFSIESLSCGDFDGDGHEDLVFGTGNGSVVLALGDGGGGFSVGAPVAAGMAFPHLLAVADFDGDQNLDVVAMQSGTSFSSLLLGDGAGGLAAPVPIAVNSSLKTDVIAADLDDDSDVDLVVSDYGAAQVSFLANDGAANFASSVALPGTGTSFHMTLVDLDGSGKLDLVQLSAGLRAVLDPLASPNPVVVVRPTSGQEAALTIGKVDGDSFPDAIIASAAGSNGAVVVARGAAGEVFAGRPWTFVDESLKALGSHDYDGDGDLDVLLADRTLGELRVMANDGNGGFSLLSSQAIASKFGYASAADLDGDGLLDVVASTAPTAPPFTHQIIVARGLAGGSFTTVVQDATPTLADILGYGGGDNVIVFGNFDGDAQLDFALRVIALPPQSGTHLIFGNSSAGWHPGAPQVLPLPSFGAVAALDFDLDGRSDLALGSATALDSVTLVRNSGFPSFTIHQTVALPSKAYSLQPIDLDGDASVDLAAATFSSTANIVVLLDGPGATLNVAQTFPIPPLLSAFALERADVDGDGLQDVVGYGDGNVLTMRSNGDGTLDAPITHAVASSITNAVLAADFTGDGRTDLYTSAGGNSSVGSTYLAVAGCATTVGRYGIPCPMPVGTKPDLSLDGCVEPENRVTLRLSGAVGSSLAMLIFGNGPGQAALPGGCSLAVTPVLPNAIPLIVTIDGHATLSGPIRQGLSGSPFTMQVLLPVGGGLGATNGLEVRVGP